MASPAAGQWGTVSGTCQIRNRPSALATSHLKPFGGAQLPFYNPTSKNSVRSRQQHTRRSASRNVRVTRSSLAEVEGTPAPAAVGNVMLEVKGLTAKIADSGKEILKGVDLVIREGEVSSPLHNPPPKGDDKAHLRSSTRINCFVEDLDWLNFCLWLSICGPYHEATLFSFSNNQSPFFLFAGPCHHGQKRMRKKHSLQGAPLSATPILPRVSFCHPPSSPHFHLTI